MRGVAEGFVKDRTLANATIDQDRILRTVAREDIRFQRDKQFIGRVGVGAENRLAADDDDLGRVRVAGGSADDVLKLRPIQVPGTRG